MPPENVLKVWKEEISAKQEDSPSEFFYAETSIGRFDLEAIQQCLSLHKASSIKCAVTR
jgi:hypothetical protein